MKEHLDASQLEAGLPAILDSPADQGRRLRLRGLNARVVRPGTVRTGDMVRKMGQGEEA